MQALSLFYPQNSALHRKNGLAQRKGQLVCSVFYVQLPRLRKKLCTCDILWTSSFFSDVEPLTNPPLLLTRGRRSKCNFNILYYSKKQFPLTSDLEIELLLQVLPHGYFMALNSREVMDDVVVVETV